MKSFKFIALGTVAVMSFGAFSQAQAADYNGFTSHHLVDEEPYEAYAEALPAEEKLELREYLDYEYGREYCQFYQPIPQGFVRDGCEIKRVEPQRRVVMVQAERQEAQPQMNVSNVIQDYEVHFAFDSSDLETSEQQTLDQVAREIEKYNPREVTVAGHTDRAGSSEYNEGLSQRRADAVSQALNSRGVTNRVIDKEAYGENRPAVETGNGVPLRENRRVVVEFRK